jgi:probable HAF family extracellular repeat protein
VRGHSAVDGCPKPVLGQQDGDQQLSITDLGTLPGGIYSQAEGINGRGQVVGSSHTASDQYHAFLWKGGQMRTLPGGPVTEFGIVSVAHGINNWGQVVGYGTTASGRLHALLWSK